MRTQRILAQVLTLAGVTALAALTAPPAAAQKGAAPAVKKPALTRLEIFPKRFTLRGSRATQMLVVSGVYSDGSVRDLSEKAVYHSYNKKIAKVSKRGIVEPTTGMGPGVSIKARVGNLAAHVYAKIVREKDDRRVSFINEIEPILTKAGCNQGACHGSQLGQGGFKLSLLGFDAKSDYEWIVKEREGRRVVLGNPKESLLIQKPSMALPHAGGPRFRPGDYGYDTLLAWLEDGAPGPDASHPTVESITLYPPEHLMSVDEDQRLLVQATFSDGSSEDVTNKTPFSSLMDTVAVVDEEGLITVEGKGQTAIMATYAGAAAAWRVVVPYRQATPEMLAVYKSFPRANYIDDAVVARWRMMGLLPSGFADDATFIRRVYLDVVGLLPTRAEVEAYVGSKDVKKREKLIDEVLNRPEYVDYWSLKWGDLLRINRTKLQEKGMWSFYNWVRAAMRDNMPMDEFVRQLITAQGSTFTTGPANYFRVASNAPDLAETTSQLFLGVRIVCARCHHHPYEKWGQDDYYQFAAFFARVGLKNSTEFGLFGREQVVRVRKTGEVRHPRTGQIMKPTPLDGVPMDDPVDRRRPLAAWITSKENTLFSGNLVNRYFGYLMGRGLVEPLDDVRVTNPASNGSLLAAMAADLVEHNFDQKYMLRQILLTNVYALSSEATEENQRDLLFYTKYEIKRLPAEVLLDAVFSATGKLDKFTQLPLGTRATQLPDSSVASYFLDTFGRPARVAVCECERSPDPNIAQVLHLMNGDYIQSKITASDGRLGKLIAAKKGDEEIVTELYYATVSRAPTTDEMATAILSVKEAPDRTEGLQDVLWALLNTREFFFAH